MIFLTSLLSGIPWLAQINPYLFWIALFLGLLTVASVLRRLMALAPVTRFVFRYFIYVLSAVIIVGSTVLFWLWFQVTNLEPEQTEIDYPGKFAADYQVWKTALQGLNHPSAAPAVETDETEVGWFGKFFRFRGIDPIAKKIVLSRLPAGWKLEECKLTSYKIVDGAFAAHFMVKLVALEDQSLVPVLPADPGKHPDLSKFLLYADDLPAGLVFSVAQAQRMFPSGQEVSLSWEVRKVKRVSGYWHFLDSAPLVVERRPLFEGRFLAESAGSPPRLLRDADDLAQAGARAGEAVASLDQALASIDAAVLGYVPSPSTHLTAHGVKPLNWHLNATVNAPGVGGVNVDLAQLYQTFGKMASASHDGEVAQQEAAAQRSEARAQTKAYRVSLYQNLVAQLQSAATEHDALFGYMPAPVAN